MVPVEVDDEPKHAAKPRGVGYGMKVSTVESTGGETVCMPGPRALETAPSNSDEVPGWMEVDEET